MCGWLPGRGGVKHTQKRVNGVVCKSADWARSAGAGEGTVIDGIGIGTRRASLSLEQLGRCAGFL
jgi:hypothetical protein